MWHFNAFMTTAEVLRGPNLLENMQNHRSRLSENDKEVGCIRAIQVSSKKIAPNLSSHYADWVLVLY